MKKKEHTSLGPNMINTFEQEPSFKIEKYDPITAQWEVIAPDLLEIVEKAFLGKVSSIDWLKKNFDDQETVALIVKEISTDRVVGYAYALPLHGYEADDTVHLAAIAIHPRCQKNKLTGGMMSIMEDEFLKRGYRYISGDYAIENGFADTVQKHYASRVVEVQNWQRPDGVSQRHMKIRLQ